MKQSALLFAILLLTACASSNDGFVDQSSHGCAPGNPVEVEAGLDMPAGIDSFGNTATAHVQLSNNSDDDVTVKSIRVDPRINAQVRYQLDNGYLDVNQVLKEAESEQYEIPLTVRRNSPTMADDPRRTDGRTTSADLAVTVVLSNGEAYRCQFRVPVPLF
ncbi:MAG TPA: hypothetical protein VEK11_09165 [Thermoanaerobaculia bacterium]|nr:hypothetical protein [Thermoanaerobaculia bacterium]